MMHPANTPKEAPRLSVDMMALPALRSQSSAAAAGGMCTRTKPCPVKTTILTTTRASIRNTRVHHPTIQPPLHPCPHPHPHPQPHHQLRPRSTAPPRTHRQNHHRRAHRPPLHPQPAAPFPSEHPRPESRGPLEQAGLGNPAVAVWAAVPRGCGQGGGGVCG
ncbi:hypothetical protein DFP73DRAFT_533784 [Morchella snyderi]|nr:hypothetical protein DFP73DRAFT_533784 [Morchella snyderi]